MSEHTMITGQVVANASPETRQSFLNKTYYHLLGAILLLVGIEMFLFRSGLADSIFEITRSVNWLIILGIFMFLSSIVSNFAYSSSSRTTQYAALGGYVLLWALMLVALIYPIVTYGDPSLLQKAATATLVCFGALTAIVAFTGKDFSFLRSFLIWGGVVAIIAIAASVLVGLQLGMIFILAMLAYSGAAILYTTDRVLKHYPEEYYVGAALALFSSIAMLFWYVAQFFMSSE